MQKHYLVVLLVLVLQTGCGAKEPHPIIGKWQLIGASIIIPETCHGATINFTTDGFLISKSGMLEERKSYTVKPYRNGYLVDAHYISDNDKKNCQGYPARFARRQSVNKIYIEVINQGHNLKMYFHPVEDRGYLIVERM